MVALTVAGSPIATGSVVSEDIRTGRSPYLSGIMRNYVWYSEGGKIGKVAAFIFLYVIPIWWLTDPVIWLKNKITDHQSQPKGVPQVTVNVAHRLEAEQVKGAFALAIATFRTGESSTRQIQAAGKMLKNYVEIEKLPAGNAMDLIKTIEGAGSPQQDLVESIVRRAIFYNAAMNGVGLSILAKAIDDLSNSPIDSVRAGIGFLNSTIDFLQKNKLILNKQRIEPLSRKIISGLFRQAAGRVLVKLPACESALVVAAVKLNMTLGVNVDIRRDIIPLIRALPQVSHR